MKELCDFFAHESQEINKSIDALEAIFDQHGLGYKNLFEKLIEFSRVYYQVNIWIQP